MKVIQVGLCLIFFISCTHYVEKVHQKIDNELTPPPKPRVEEDKFAIYRKKNYRAPLSTKNKRRLLPKIKRQYESASKKHYKANDLNDNQSDGSLWSGRDGKKSISFHQK